MTNQRNGRHEKADLVPASGLCPTVICQACQAVALAGLEAMCAFEPLMRRKFVAAGDPITRLSGDQGGLTVVAEGVAMVQRILSDGRRQVLAFRFPGDVANFNGADDPRPQTVALTDVALCRVDGKTLADFGLAYPAAAEKLASLAGGEASRLADHMMVLGRLTAAERVAAFLLECLMRGGRTTADGLAVTLPMTRDDIADYLGINVETVSRQFSRLKAAKVIRLPKPGQVVVPSLTVLQARVPFTPGAWDREGDPVSEPSFAA
jgi:CRP-like cAMP-binding protein